jgi:hypothetical protein
MMNKDVDKRPTSFNLTSSMQCWGFVNDDLRLIVVGVSVAVKKIKTSATTKRISLEELNLMQCV